VAERERKSPKFYIAEGIMLRMREAIAYVFDELDLTDVAKDRRERALMLQNSGVLESLTHCGVITTEEQVELKLKLSELLDADEEKREKKDV
jgi:hypothetical protein